MCVSGLECSVLCTDNAVLTGASGWMLLLVTVWVLVLVLLALNVELFRPSLLLLGIAVIK